MISWGISSPTRGTDSGGISASGLAEIRIAAKAATKEDALRLVEPVEAEVRQLIGKHIFAVDEETMEDAVANSCVRKTRRLR